MKITCPKCAARYPLDPSLVPPSGTMMRCPACLHTFPVKAEDLAEPELGIGLDDLLSSPRELAAAAPGTGGRLAGTTLPRRSPQPIKDLGVDLPAFPPGLESDLPAPELPVPRGGAARSPVRALAPAEDDLPTPLGPPTRRGAAGLEPAAPRGRAAMPSDPLDLPDLPVPIPTHKTRQRLDDLPVPLRRGGGRDPHGPDLADLPAPLADLPAPLADLPAPLADLPMPVASDLPAPVASELPVPVMPELLIPVAPDLIEPVGAPAPEPVRLDDFGIDLDASLPAPEPGGLVKPAVDDLADLADLAELATRPIPVDEEAKAEKLKEQAEKGGLLQRLSRKQLILGGTAAVLLWVLGAGGFYAWQMTMGKRRALRAMTAEVSALIGEDSPSASKKAAEKMENFAIENSTDPVVLALFAQAQLAAGRFGTKADLLAAQGTLARVPRKSHDVRAVKAALGLEMLLNQDNPQEAVRMLAPLAEGAPAAEDSLAPLYLGWADLKASLPQQAEKAFQVALKVNPRMAAALYGLGQAREQQGDAKSAAEAYAKVLEIAPQHFGAFVGRIRVSGGDPARSETQLLEAVTRRKDAASRRELADTWTLLGVRALEQSRRRDAEDRLRKALAVDPTQNTAQVALARLLCDQDKHAEAAALAKSAFQTAPRNLDAGLTLVRAYLGMKKPLDAGAPLEAVAKLAPQDARVPYWQGKREEAIGATGSPDKAAALYRKAIERDQKYLDAYIALSRVLSRQGRTTDALAALTQVASQAEGDPKLASALGEAYLAVGDATHAEGALRMALVRQPDNHPVRMNLVQALELQNRLRDADLELQEIEKRNKDYPGLAERRAQLLLRQQRYEEAESQFLIAAAQPGASHALKLDAASYALKSHPQEAEALIRQVIKENIRSGRAYTLLALLKLAQGAVSEAGTAIELASRLDDSPQMHLARGMVQQAQGRKLDALDSIARARHAPVEATAMALHARMLAEQQRYDEAMQEVADLIARKDALLADRTVYRTDDVNELLGGAYLLLGDLLTMVGKEDKARDAYSQAVAHAPRSGEAAARYGRALYLSGKRAQAARNLARAIALGGDTAPYALESYMFLGDSYRELRQRGEALRAYQKWLSLAAPDAPERPEVERFVLALGEGRRHR